MEKRKATSAISRLLTLGDPNGSVYMNSTNGGKLRDEDLKTITMYVAESEPVNVTDFKEGELYIDEILESYICKLCGQETITWRDAPQYCTWCGAKNREYEE